MLHQFHVCLWTCSPADNLLWPFTVQEVVILLKKISVAPAPPAAKSVATATAQASAGVQLRQRQCMPEHSYPSWDPDALRHFGATAAAQHTASYHWLAVSKQLLLRGGIPAVRDVPLASCFTRPQHIHDILSPTACHAGSSFSHSNICLSRCGELPCT